MNHVVADMFYKRNEITREKEKIMGIRTRLAVLACKTSNAVLRRMGQAERTCRARSH
ncbi:MAG: hypothetical protein ACLR2O_07105 [Coprococcus sp.]